MAKRIRPCHGPANKSRGGKIDRPWPRHRVVKQRVTSGRNDSFKCSAERTDELKHREPWEGFPLTYEKESNSKHQIVECVQ
jgi:hypothetical protein